MSLTGLFVRMGAPLANQRWSWGAERPDGVVFLRVWQDRRKRIGNKTFMMITHHSAYTDDPDSLGYQERLRHVDKVEAGAECYMVMCLVEDPEERPRQIKSYNKMEVFLGGEIIEIDGDMWLELKERVPVNQVAT